MAGAPVDFDPLTTTATDLRQLLDQNKISSVQIAERYLAQISRHDSKLRAFISLAPRDKLLRAAASLDEERLRGKTRSPLHGVPVVLKDNFVTAAEMGMGTTAGSWALVGARAKGNGAIVQRLVDAGMLVLGKTNMTEFAGMKMTMISPGWSPVGGQTVSPYTGPMVEGETLLGHSAPGGSSTGSAVAVAAGFSPLAMGTETIGSIVTPASRAALYALKPTVGVQNTTGMYSLTDFYDSPGPMARCAADVQTIAEILLGRSLSRPRQHTGSWEGLSVAFLDPSVWRMAEAMCRQHQGTAEQMREDYEEAMARLERSGCSVKFPVEVADISALTVDGEHAIMPIAFWDFKNICIPRFLKAFEECAVNSLQDIVRFNEEHKDKCLPPEFPEQGDLIKARDNQDTEEHIAAQKEGLRAVAKNVLNAVFEREGVNIIAAPADSSLCIHAAASGYPIATVPLGKLRYNSRPFGLCMVAREDEEDKLLQFMAAYETVSLPRAVPEL